MTLARYSLIVEQIIALTPKRLTLREVCRRVRGRGFDRLCLLFGPTLSVSPEFGCAIKQLVFAGVIRLEDLRGVRVLPGRNYHTFRVSAIQKNGRNQERS